MMECGRVNVTGFASFTPFVGRLLFFMFGYFGYIGLNVYELL